MSTPRMVLKPVRLNLEKLRPILRDIFAHYGKEAVREAQENPELIITSLLLRIKDNLPRPGGCYILVEGARYDIFKEAARELLESK